MSKREGIFERIFFLNTEWQMDFYYEIFYVIINHAISKQNLIELLKLIDLYFINLDPKEIFPLEEEKADENEEKQKKIPKIFKNLKILQEWFDLVYYSETENRFRSKNQIMDPQNYSRHDFYLQLIKQIKQNISGTWGNFGYNATLLLFYSYLIDSNTKIIYYKTEDGKKSKFLEETNDFVKFMQKHGAAPRTPKSNQLIKWEKGKKIELLLKFYNEFGLVYEFNDKYFTLGDPIFIKKLRESILTELKDIFIDRLRSPENIVFISIEELLKHIDINYFFLPIRYSTAEINLPYFIQDFLITFEREGKVILSDAGDSKSYRFPILERTYRSIGIKI